MAIYYEFAVVDNSKIVNFRAFQPRSLCSYRQSTIYKGSSAVAWKAIGSTVAVRGRPDERRLLAAANCADVCADVGVWNFCFVLVGLRGFEPPPRLPNAAD
jgi:hypothetical protein